MTPVIWRSTQAESQRDEAAGDGGRSRRKTRPSIIRSASASNIATAPAISTPAAICNHVVAENTGNEIRFGCGVDCEGGGIGVAMSKDDKSALIRLERIRIWERNKPDDDASDDLVAGADDKIFRVDRADLRECCRTGDRSQGTRRAQAQVTATSVRARGRTPCIDAISCGARFRLSAQPSPPLAPARLPRRHLRQS